jgi:hypothetical protein
MDKDKEGVPDANQKPEKAEPAADDVCTDTWYKRVVRFFTGRVTYGGSCKCSKCKPDPRRQVEKWITESKARHSDANQSSDSTRPPPATAPARNRY